MIQIKEFKTLDDKKICFRFSDNTEKIIDFSTFIVNDRLSRALSDQNYFEKVKLYKNGRGIYWPNGYDFCPDFLYNYQTSKKFAMNK